MGAVDQAVQDGLGQDRVGEEFIPVFAGTVGDDNGGTSPVAFGEEFVEVLGLLRWHSGVFSQTRTDLSPSVLGTAWPALTPSRRQSMPAVKGLLCHSWKSLAGEPAPVALRIGVT